LEVKYAKRLILLIFALILLTYTNPSAQEKAIPKGMLSPTATVTSLALRMSFMFMCGGKNLFLVRSPSEWTEDIASLIDEVEAAGFTPGS